jgi:hypothetical protein
MRFFAVAIGRRSNQDDAAGENVDEELRIRALENDDTKARAGVHSRDPILRASNTVLSTI